MGPAKFWRQHMPPKFGVRSRSCAEFAASFTVCIHLPSFTRRVLINICHHFTAPLPCLIVFLPSLAACALLLRRARTQRLSRTLLLCRRRCCDGLPSIPSESRYRRCSRGTFSLFLPYFLAVSLFRSLWRLSSNCMISYCFFLLSFRNLETK